MDFVIILCKKDNRPVGFEAKVPTIQEKEVYLLNCKDNC